jgi:hypothetical protein
MSDSYTHPLTSAFDKALTNAGAFATSPIAKRLDDIIFELDGEGVFVTNFKLSKFGYHFDIKGPVLVTQSETGTSETQPCGEWWICHLLTDELNRKNEFNRKRSSIKGLSDHAEGLLVEFTQLLQWLAINNYAAPYSPRGRSPFRKGYKVRVRSKEDSDAVQEALFSVGYGWHISSHPSQELEEYTEYTVAHYFSSYSKLITTSYVTDDSEGVGYFENHSSEEITIPELKSIIDDFISRFH